MAKSNVVFFYYLISEKYNLNLIFVIIFRFPHVRLRLGRYEYEDRRLLCIAAMDFYHSVRILKIILNIIVFILKNLHFSFPTKTKSSCIKNHSNLQLSQKILFKILYYV